MKKVRNVNSDQVRKARQKFISSCFCRSDVDRYTTRQQNENDDDDIRQQHDNIRKRKFLGTFLLMLLFRPSSYRIFHIYLDGNGVIRKKRRKSFLAISLAHFHSRFQFAVCCSFSQDHLGSRMSRPFTTRLNRTKQTTPKLAM